MGNNVESTEWWRYYGGIQKGRKVIFTRDLELDNSAIRARNRKYRTVPKGTIGIIKARIPADASSSGANLARYNVWVGDRVFSAIPECFIEEVK